MNLDFLASMTLAAQALLLPGILVFSSRLDSAQRAIVLLGIAGGWLLLRGEVSPQRAASFP
jgi:hypothetical protein